MAFFVPPFNDSEPSLPALVQVVTRGEVEWNKPVFKAPPLHVKVPAITIEEPFFAQIPKIERLKR